METLRLDSPRKDKGQITGFCPEVGRFGLILSRRCDMLNRGKMGEKGSDFSFPHLTGVFLMMKKYITPDPLVMPQVNSYVEN